MVTERCGGRRRIPIESFEINIENARCGWIDVELCLGAERLHFAASDVANDPLHQLAELALAVVRGERSEVRAVFWLEPSGYELRARCDSALELTVSHSESAFAHLFDPTVVVRQPVDALATAAEILRCLRTAKRLFATTAVADARPWAHPFPDVLVIQLERDVATRTSSHDAND